MTTEQAAKRGYAAEVQTGRVAASGYFTRWYCIRGHAHRKEDRARACSARFDRKLAAGREWKP